MIDRRGLLTKGLLGGALLGSAALAISLRPVRRIRETTPPLRVLSEASFWTLVAVAERVAPANADAIAIASGVDLALIATPLEAQRDLNRLLALLENGVAGLIWNGTITPFSSRDPEARDATLAEWQHSRLAIRRTGAQALRKLCLATYYSEPSTWAAFGYAGPTSTGGFFYDDSKAGAG